MNKKQNKSIFYNLLLLIVFTHCIVDVYAAIPDMTPGELLIRLTPNAYEDLQSLQAKSDAAELLSSHNVESYKPVFTSFNRSSDNSNISRTYLLRFSTDSDLIPLKTLFEESELIEEVSFNYLRPVLGKGIIPSDPKYEEQWSLPLINMPQAWNIEKGRRDVVIAIIDSGIDYKHDDLSQKIWINPNEIPDNGLDDDGNGYIDDIHGWDFTDAPNLQAEGDFMEGDNEPIDESGHGTHVAGIAGAMPDNGVGIAGIAWNSSLMAVRAGLSLGGSSRMQDDDSAAAIVYAVDNGASIINMSWGSSQHSFVIEDAIDYAYNRGVLLIGAAGNDGKATSIFPAGYRKVISVSSTTQHRQRYYKANFGASVDIAAPGNAILSTQIGNKYRILTGTSMAAPHIAGIAALMKSKRPALTPEEIRHILINTTDPVFEKDSDEQDTTLVGAGTVNAERALLASGVLHARILSPETNSGGSTSIPFTGTAGGYKFDSWQLFYGSSSVPTTFIPFTDIITEQKMNEELIVWDTTNVPEDVYTVRLVVTGRDGSETRDHVVLTVDRTPPKIDSINITEAIYQDGSTTILSWITDDVTRNKVFYRRAGHIAPFASIEENEIGKEHLFSLALETGQYQFYFSANNTVGLNTVDNNNGKYYSVNVVGPTISPNGYIERDLNIPALHLTDIVVDFDKDGLLEFIGTSLFDTSDDLSPTSSLVIYERSPTGRYNLVHSLTDIADVVDTANGLNPNIDIETFVSTTVADADNDGLPEILAYDSDRTFLIESLEPKSYPTQIIWETPFISGGKIIDLDGDGNKEIIGVDNSNNRILIYENRGNNLFDRSAALINETDGKNIYAPDIVIDDFTGNGKKSVVVGDSEGELFFYGATGNDSYRLNLKVKTEIDVVKQLISGDLTGDGKPELVVTGTSHLPDITASSPIWKLVVYTYISGQYRRLWEQNIAPYRIKGNSLSIAEVDGDQTNELIVITNPNLYIMNWNGNTFIPVFHQKVSETPTLLTADMDNNGFDESYVNFEDGLRYIESSFAKNRNSVASLTPWDVSAKPITSRVVQITWESVDDTDIQSGFTIYRAKGDKQEKPADTEFKTIAKDVSTHRYLDRSVEIDTTYWYTVTTKNEKGIETKRSDAVSATPRSAPTILSATYQQPNSIVVAFDRRMNTTISNEGRYNLRIEKQLVGINPVSAIRDRMGTRVLLAFDTTQLQSFISNPMNQYEIVVNNIADIDENSIRDGTQVVEIQRNINEVKISDLSNHRVFPNPIQPHVSDKGAITFDKVPVGTRIHLYTPKGELLEELQVSESDGNSKKWWLTNGSIGDIATGIYIYILEFEEEKKVGKIAVIK
ncbi:S8 family serine peptidase [Candidatus Poribacteria bacterium]|nr:S8 family serine peptidase [Candidatus Poribacteria bacterium]